MIVRRKFNLSLYLKDKKYETLDIEIEGDNIQDLIKWIDDTFKYYLYAIMEKRIQ